MLQGEARAYRRVCRLAIKYDKKARCARLGFRRRQSTELVEVDACPVFVITSYSIHYTKLYEAPLLGSRALKSRALFSTHPTRRVE